MNKTILDRYNALKLQEKVIKKELEILRKDILGHYSEGMTQDNGFSVEIKHVVSSVLDTAKLKEHLGTMINVFQKDRVSTRVSLTKLSEGIENVSGEVSEKEVG